MQERLNRTGDEVTYETLVVINCKTGGRGEMVVMMVVVTRDVVVVVAINDRGRDVYRSPSGNDSVYISKRVRLYTNYRNGGVQAALQV